MKKISLLLFFAFAVTGLFAQTYRLISPKDNFIFSDTSAIVFKWNVVDSALSYDINVATDNNFSNIVFSRTALSVTTAQNNFTTGSSYYWRIRATTSHGAQAWSYYRKFTVFTPTQVPGLTMWFDASQNVVTSGGKVTQWSDLSSSALVATQSSTSNQPTFTASVSQLKNKPVVHFTGSTSSPTYLNYTTQNYTRYTAIMVRNYVHNSNYVQYVLAGNASGICSESNYYTAGYGSYSNLTNTDAMFGSALSELVTPYSIYTTEPSKLFRNGKSSAIGKSAQIPGISISAMGTRPNLTILAYQGDVAEILLYNDTLSDDNRQSAEGYLRYKYSGVVDLGADTIFQKFCVNTTLQASAGFSSYVWSTGATTSSITVTTFGRFAVQATDALGYTSTDTVEVRPMIRFNQLAKNVKLCKKDSVQWNSGYPSTGYTFSWSNGATTSSIVIKTPGDYSVKIKDGFNCFFYSDTVHVTIDSFPDFKLGNDTSLCAGNQLNFRYIYPLKSIQWSNGDTTQTPVINTPGNYSVVAYNINGCRAGDTIGVAIKGIAPTVNFGSSTPCLGDTLSFTDSSSAPSGHSIIGWRWTFAGTDTSNLQNPQYRFSSYGNNTVSLTAITDSGCINTLTKTLKVNLKPQPFFQAKIACALSKTAFTDYSATTLPATITNWLWKFDGADSSAYQNPIYSFPGSGIYTVSLKVTNSDGCADVYRDSIEVFAPFAANFTVAHTCIGDSTIFTDATKSLSVVQWLWIPGDGSTLDNLTTIKHRYAAPGVYNASLIVRNAIGCMDSITKPVNIVQYPTAAFGNLFTCQGAPYTPLDSSISPNEPIGKWQWDINGHKYNNRAPQSTFTDSGSVPVKLVVTTQSGCADSVTQLVTVVPNPSVAFSFSPLYGDAPVDVTFKNLTSHTNSNTYVWSFGDDSTSTEINPTHTYAVDDSFPIKLVATSPYGCNDSSFGHFIAKPTDLDLSVDQVITSTEAKDDGTTLITVTALVSNLGTRAITQTTFYALLGTGGVITENWTGVLQSGLKMNYTFSAKFVTGQISSDSYVCVEAKSVNNGQTEITTSNNKQCGSVSGTVQLIGPSPNPSYQHAYLGIILPKAGQITLTVCDVTGRFVINNTTLSLPMGRTDYDIPVNSYRAGEYLVRIQYNDDIFIRKFVVE